MSGLLWRRFVFALSLLINMVLVYQLLWGDQGLRGYQGLKKEYRIMEARIKELDEKNIILSREIRLLQTDEKYLEQVIRNRLNFVKDNEILYIFPGAKETARTGANSDEAKN